MEFWYALIALVAVILLFLQVCFFVKRAIAISKLKKQCKIEGYSICGTHPLWQWGRKQAKKCDFYIETEKELFSVKLFASARRGRLLVVCENNEYFFRRINVFFAFGSILRFYTDMSRRKFPQYDFSYKCTNKTKKTRNILLIYPAYNTPLYQPSLGGERELSVGDELNGIELHTLSSFIEDIKAKP